MNLKPYLIDYVGKLLLDKDLWNRSKVFVQNVASTDLTSEEKRQRVRQDLLFFCSTLGSSLLNFCIELGVMYLKAKQK